METNEFITTWLNPPAEFRSAPFWSWNAALEPDRLCRAIESMNAAGMGGFFMHSRYGLQTPYLSERWFECVSACVEKARHLAMKAYLYDEDRWPSGTAGGRVTRDKKANRQRALMALPAGQAGKDGKALATFAVRRDEEGRVSEYRRDDQAGDGEELVAFEVRIQPPSGWHNDGSYLDPMRKGAVRDFIASTYDAYAERCGRDFGGLIPAIFTDEPNIHYQPGGWGVPADYIPWTERMPEEFAKRRGYDLMECLPEAVFPSGSGVFSKVRHDLWRTATELFVEHFSAQIGRWCGRHGIALTGHMLAEGSLAAQIGAAGACMPHYRHMQWPGIDNLRDQARELITAKQCSSVADQFGKERMLSELYGCTGWDWPLEGHKFIGDWQAACGVNLRCPHLTHYSLAGGAKRDYPASIFSHSPWWRHYAAVEDYFARLSLLLTRGKPVRDVLLLHPVESAWGLYLANASTRSGEVEALNESLTRIMYALSGEHYDWDFGDESILDDRGKIVRDELRVGRMAYRLVVVPPCHSLRASTVRLLESFLEAGGRVMFVGRKPALVDAEPGNDALGALLEKADGCEDDEEGFVAGLQSALERRVSISEGGREQRCIWTMLRRVRSSDLGGLGGGQLLFMQSHDRREDREVRVSVAGRGPVVLWDLRTGERLRLKSQSAPGRIEFDLRLPPTGSALVSLGVPSRGAAAPTRPPRVASADSIDGRYAIERTEANTLPLDYCRFRLGEEPFSDLVPTLKADALIRSRFGLGDRLGRGHQPWYLYATGVVDTSPRGRAEIRRSFHVSEVPSSCKLAIERPEDFEILVNGQPAGPPDGWWVDEDIRAVDLTGLLKQGENELLLRFEYRPDMELEDVYLVGEFGVGWRSEDRRPEGPTLIAPPESLEIGSWVGQGLDFYGGGVRYRLEAPPARPGQRVRIRLPEVACTAAVVHAGGRSYVLPWPPFEADITEGLSEGGNVVWVEVIGGRKNILGPLHVPWREWTGPGEFDPDNERWTDAYQLTDHGLMAAPVIETLSS